MPEEPVEEMEVIEEEESPENSPIHPDVKKNEKDTLKRLNAALKSYKAWREEHMEPVWEDIRRAYLGIDNKPMSPYSANYIIKEVFRQVESLKPQYHEALFGGDNLFQYKATKEGDEDRCSAATEKVHHDIRSGESLDELYRWAESTPMWGTSYLMYGWATFKQHLIKRSRAHDPDGKGVDTIETDDAEYGKPYVRWLNHWSIYTDPTTERCKDSPYCFLVETVSWEYLKTLAKEGYLDEKAVIKALKDAKQEHREQAAEDSDHNLEDIDGLRISDDKEFQMRTCWTNGGWEYVQIDTEHLVRGQRSMFGHAPILELRNYRQAGWHYGIGEPEVMMDDQLLLRDICSMWVDSVHYSLQPMWKVKKSAMKDWNTVAFQPGETVQVEDHDDVSPMTAPNVTFALDGAINKVRENMQLATGVTDELSGVGSKQRTASGLSRLQDAAALRKRHNLNIWKPVFQELYTHLYELERAFYDREETIMVTGPDGKEAFEDVDKTAFDGDVSVDVVIAEDIESKPEAQARWLSLWQTVAADPRFEHAVIQEELLRAFNIKNPKRAIANPATSAQQAGDENMQFVVSGVIDDPSPGENHALHMQMHQPVLGSPEFQAMPMEFQAMFHEHIKQHMAYMEQMMGAGAQGAQQGDGDTGSQSIVPGQDVATEAQFSNAAAGSMSQGMVPDPTAPQARGVGM